MSSQLVLSECNVCAVGEWDVALHGAGGPYSSKRLLLSSFRQPCQVEISVAKRLREVKALA